ncbi:hypothetical protein SAMN04488051_101116 [Alkalimonas amylolytica]|uniref:Uncharacterized protein n=1 Tax=Alkalimonas amylolytica TaxID=152573 RepID=A0A1H3X5T9_ALKAM|nr:hypothetical protein SAMN04488051_101116 [Alkalimonas amylolytica]
MPAIGYSQQLNGKSLHFLLAFATLTHLGGVRGVQPIRSWTHRV